MHFHHILLFSYERSLDYIYSTKHKMQAHLEAVNLSINSFFTPEFASSNYLNYGAAVSEASFSSSSSSFFFF